MAVNRRFTSRLSIRHAFKASVSVSARYLVQLTDIPSAGTAVSLQADSICRPVVFLLQGNNFVVLPGNNFDNAHKFLFKKKKKNEKKLGLAFGSKPGDRVMTADMFSQFLPNKLLHKFVLFHPDVCHSDALGSRSPLGLAVRQLGRCLHGDQEDRLISGSPWSTQGILGSLHEGSMRR